MDHLSRQILKEIRNFFNLNKTINESHDSDQILDLISEINKFKDEVSKTEPEAVPDMELIYKAISAYANENIDATKMLTIARKIDETLDNNWGFSGIFHIIKLFLQSDITQNGAAEVKKVIIIPGDGVRDTIFTILDDTPTESDVKSFLKHVIDTHWGEDTRQPWEDEDKRFPKIVSSNRHFTDRDAEVRWLMHPQNLQKNLKIMSIFVLEDAESVDNRIIWDDGRNLYLGDRNQYMDAFKMKKVKKKFVTGRGNPWEIKQEEIDGGYDNF